MVFRVSRVHLAKHVEDGRGEGKESHVHRIHTVQLDGTEAFPVWVTVRVRARSTSGLGLGLGLGLGQLDGIEAFPLAAPGERFDNPPSVEI